MKLFEIKRPPFGIHEYAFQNPGVYNGPYIPDGSTLIYNGVHARYARTAAHLEKFVTGFLTEPSNGQRIKKHITPDKLVILTVYEINDKPFTVFWINHTGTLNTWEDVKEYYGLDSIGRRRRKK